MNYILEGVISHHRTSPIAYGFKKKAFFFALNLNDLESRGLLHSFGLFSWKRKDYFGSGTLFDTVKDQIQKRGYRFSGTIYLVTQLRFLGFTFNPVSFYYCFDSKGELAFILAEITNTPWFEKFIYCLPCTGQKETGMITHQFDKAFHVSPFLDMNYTYLWRFSDFTNEIKIQMENRKASDVDFYASFTGKRVPLTRGSLFRCMLRYPFMGLQTVFLIYYHALILWLRKVPFYAHPNPNSRLY